MWIQIVLTVLVALLAVYLGIKFVDANVIRRQKALLVLFVQEFALLIRRGAHYYRQYLEGPDTPLSFFEAVDAHTFSQLCEVTGNMKVIETALMLKSDFSHVLRYAAQAAEAISLQVAAEGAGETALAQQAVRKSAFAREMALNCFLGEVKVGGKFFRAKYHDYISNIRFLLDHLESLNRPQLPQTLLLSIFKRLRIEKTALDEFIAQRRRELILLEQKLDLLREKEMHTVSDPASAGQSPSQP
jgi:hypothetical protein